MQAQLNFHVRRLVISLVVFVGAAIFIHSQATAIEHYVGLIGGLVFYANMGLVCVYNLMLTRTEQRIRESNAVFEITPIVIIVVALANIAFFFMYGD